MQENTINPVPRNTLRKEEIKTGEPGEKKEKKEKKPRASVKSADDMQEPELGKLEKFSQVVGVFSLLASLFLLLAFVSYIFNWFSGGTDDIFSGIRFSRVLTDNTIETHNLGGRLGAAISTLFIKQGFGIGSFLMVIWLFILGVRFTLKHSIIALGKSFGMAILGMVWLSVTLGFLASDTRFSILGGISGYESSLWLQGLLGKMGLSLLLVFVFVTFLVLVYNFSLHTVRQRISKKAAAEEINEKALTPESTRNTSVSDFPFDKYNTVEFAVKDEHPSVENRTSPLSGTLSSNVQPEPVLTRFEPWQ